MSTSNKSNSSNELEDMSKHSLSLNSENSSMSDNTVQSKKVSGGCKTTTKQKYCDNQNTKTNKLSSANVQVKIAHAKKSRNIKCNHKEKNKILLATIRKGFNKRFSTPMTKNVTACSSNPLSNKSRDEKKSNSCFQNSSAISTSNAKMSTRNFSLQANVNTNNSPASLSR